MIKNLNTEQRLLQKRKFYVRFLVVFTVLMLLAFNLGSWLFLNRMDNYLERELEKRLTAIAGLTSQRIDTEYLDDITLGDGGGIGRLLIKPQLSRLIYEQELEAAYIIDRNYVVLLDGRSEFPKGQKRTYLQQDSTAIDHAWQDSLSTSQIHVFEGNKFKTVYAPLKNDYFEVTALLVLEASADFFEILELFKRSLIIGGLVSFGLIVVFSFFISRMVTLLIRTHESMQQSEKLTAMGRMAASMAHEIRNPLGIIKGTADVLKEKYSAEETSDELFDYISAEVQRLNHLVNNFLSFAREPKLNPKSADLKNVIERAVAALEREDQDQEIEIIISAQNELALFNFDENVIQQVLFNLLINAQQAIEQDGKIEIGLNAINHKNKRYAEVTVSDNGPGIEGDTEKIFEPFYTTKSSGSGLGLAICKQIIEKHSGWIELKTEVGQGTTFKFYLPL